MLFFNILQKLTHAEVQDRIVDVLKHMETLSLDLPTMLYYISWNLPNAQVDGKLKYALLVNTSCCRKEG